MFIVALLKGELYMKFYDIDALANQYGDGNKYLITSKIAERARELSEKKDVISESEGEKFLSRALAEFEEVNAPQDLEASEALTDVTSLNPVLHHA
jgi:DNA-directed RNA polymerase subunit K/omega